MEPIYEEQQTGEITFAAIGKLIKRSALRILIYVLIAAVLATLVVLPVKFFARTEPSVTAQVEFVYDGIEKGLDPSGAAFDKEQIRNKIVLSAAVNEAGLGDSIKDIDKLRNAVRISANISPEYQTLVDQAASGNADAKKQLLNYTAVPTKYNIELTNIKGLGLDKKQSVELVNKIISCYREYFAAYYSAREPFSVEMFSFTTAAEAGLESANNSVQPTKATEFLTYAFRFDTELSTVYDYLSSFTNVNTAFRSNNGYTFSDLRAMYNVIQEESEVFFNFVVLEEVARNKDYVKREIESMQAKLKTEIANLVKQETKLYDQLKIFQPDKVLDNDGKTIEYVYGESYHAMNTEYITVTNRIRIAQDRLDRYTYLLDMFKTEGVTDPGLITEAENLALELQARGVSYIEAVNKTVSDYYNSAYGASAVNAVQTAVYARGTIDMPVLIIYGLVIVAAIAAAIIVTYVRMKDAERKKAEPVEIEAGEDESKP